MYVCMYVCVCVYTHVCTGTIRVYTYDTLHSRYSNVYSKEITYVEGTCILIHSKWTQQETV